MTSPRYHWSTQGQGFKAKRCCNDAILTSSPLAMFASLLRRAAVSRSKGILIASLFLADSLRERNLSELMRDRSDLNTKGTRDALLIT